MIDIKLIRENPDIFKKASKDKNISADIDRLIEVDTILRNDKTRLQDITTEKNKLGKAIPTLPDNEKQQTLKKLADLKNEEAQIAQSIKDLQPEFDTIMNQVPQPADEEVPLGIDDTENRELRTWGQIPTFDFKPKDHVQLGTDLGIIDIERGVKLAGTRNYFLIGDGAMLHWAVLRFSMDYMIKQGYKPMSVAHQ